MAKPSRKQSQKNSYKPSGSKRYAVLEKNLLVSFKLVARRQKQESISFLERLERQMEEEEEEELDAWWAATLSGNALLANQLWRRQLQGGRGLGKTYEEEFGITCKIVRGLGIVKVAQMRESVMVYEELIQTWLSRRETSASTVR